MASVEVPNIPGTLTLQWDLVQEDVTWFGERGSPLAEVNVNVTSAQPTAEKAPPTPSRLGSSASPPRAQLWRAGVKMWLAHPLLGVGPDNFRRVYGTYLGQTKFDDRITANSWYVEVLATTGVIGMLAGLFVVSAVAILVRRRWPTMTARSLRALALGLSVALLTFFLHGLVDYFMEFTPTYSLFWLIAGLLIGLLTGTVDDEVARTADRV
jgi:O-antigen ligase